MVKVYLGIDPGLDGALAALSADGVVHEKSLFQRDATGQLDVMELYFRLKAWHSNPNFTCFVVLEKPLGRGKLGSVQLFNFGKTCGSIETMVKILKIPYHLVAPQTWQKEFHAGFPKDMALKAKSIAVAQRLFPGEDLRKSDHKNSRVPHDGICESLILAEWGRRKNL